MSFISSIAVYCRHQIRELFLYSERDIEELFVPAAVLMACYRDYENRGVLSACEQEELYEIQQISEFTLAADLDSRNIYRSCRQLKTQEIQKIHDPLWPYTARELKDYFLLFTNGNREQSEKLAAEQIYRLKPIEDHRMRSHLNEILRWYRIPFDQKVSENLRFLVMNDTDLRAELPKRIREKADSMCRA